MKLMVIATNLNRKELLKRWILLKNRNKEIDLTILTPIKYEVGASKGYTWGDVKVMEASKYKEERLEVIPIKVMQNRFGGWKSQEVIPIIKHIKPDVIYYIGIHASGFLSKILKVAHSKKVGAKVYVFTMRGDLKPERPKSLKHKLIKLYQALKEHYKYNVKNSDAIFVHYPDAVEAFREEGYKGPLFINTQIGVDTSYFKHTQEGRENIRKALGIEDCFVFGGVSRLNPEKGILDAIKALPKNPKIKYMILGSGTEQELRNIKQTAADYGIEDQIIMPGLIDWVELPNYLSAMDCAVHIPRRTSNWVETFSLALVQEMAVGLPVIGSRSGSVTYQIGNETLMVDEGDIEGIRKKMQLVIDNKELTKQVGTKMRERTQNCFDVERLATCFDIVLDELNKGVYNIKHLDTAERWD